MSLLLKRLLLYFNDLSIIQESSIATQATGYATHATRTAQAAGAPLTAHVPGATRAAGAAQVTNSPGDTKGMSINDWGGT